MTIGKLFEMFNQDLVDFEKEHGESEVPNAWLECIPIVLCSKTAFSFYGTLSFKKRRDWLFDFCHTLTTEISNLQVR